MFEEVHEKRARDWEGAPAAVEDEGHEAIHAVLAARADMGGIEGMNERELDALENLVEAVERDTEIRKSIARLELFSARCDLVVHSANDIITAIDGLDWRDGTSRCRRTVPPLQLYASTISGPSRRAESESETEEEGGTSDWTRSSMD